MLTKIVLSLRGKSYHALGENPAAAGISATELSGTVNQITTSIFSSLSTQSTISDN